MMTNKEKQKVYDAIKEIRRGCTVDVKVDGVEYTIEPFISDTQNANGYCQEVLCKHGKGRKKRIGIATICWKDAGPNPRVFNGSRGAFIPYKNIYGVVTKGGWIG